MNRLVKEFLNDLTTVSARQPIKSRLNQFVKYANAQDLQLTEVTLNDVHIYLLNLTMRGYAVSSLNNTIKALRIFYEYLHWNQVIEDDPLRALGPFRSNRVFYVEELIEPSELYNFLISDSKFSLRDRVIVLLNFFYGIKVSELCGLVKSDFIFAECLMVVQTRGGVRRIALHDDVANLLSNYIESAKGSAYLFPNSHLGKLNKCNIYKIIWPMLSAILPFRTLESVRNSFAGALINLGVSLSEVRATTGKRYLDPLIKALPVPLNNLTENHKYFHPKERGWEKNPVTT